MSKPIFAFAMNAIVTMPNLNGTRGKITVRREHAELQASYFVEALPGTDLAPKQWFTESDLHGAQPPELVHPAPAAIVKRMKSKRGR